MTPIDNISQLYNDLTHCLNPKDKFGLTLTFTNEVLYHRYYYNVICFCEIPISDRLSKEIQQTIKSCWVNNKKVFGLDNINILVSKQRNIKLKKI